MIYLGLILLGLGLGLYVLGTFVAAVHSLRESRKDWLERDE